MQAQPSGNAQSSLRERALAFECALHPRLTLLSVPCAQRIRHDEPSDSESDGEDSRGRLDLPSMTGNLAFYSDPKDDPHLSLKEEEDIDSDEDDFTLEATDLVLIGARSEEQARDQPTLARRLLNPWTGAGTAAPCPALRRQA